MRTIWAKFLQRILRPGEIEYCQSQKVMAPHVAVRFAAKEAISKAFGTGIGRQQVAGYGGSIRRASGEPVVLLHDQGADLLKARQGSKVLVSLSHTREHATAVAIVEQ
ncbi:MAG: holo-ACP synthase [Verrucomicrobiota bacterium]